MTWCSMTSTAMSTELARGLTRQEGDGATQRAMGVAMPGHRQDILTTLGPTRLVRDMGGRDASQHCVVNS